MVHLVAERPKAALLPLLVESFGRHQAYSRLGKRPQEPWWTVALPVYFELIFLACYVLFLVGSIAFLPDLAKIEEIGISFSIAVQHSRVKSLVGSSRELLRVVEENMTRAVAVQAGRGIGLLNTTFAWRRRTSCELEKTVIADWNIAVPEGVDSSLVRSNILSKNSLAEAVQRSLVGLGSSSDGDAGSVGVRVLEVTTLTREDDAIVDMGCNLFIVATGVQLILLAYDLFEDCLACCFRTRLEKVTISLKRACFECHKVPRVGAGDHAGHGDGAVESAEKLLLVFGSLVMLVGTIYWEHPRQVAERTLSLAEEDVLVMAGTMFIIGSMASALAAFTNALYVTAANQTFTPWAVAACGMYEFGAILFLLGSVCLLPGQGCGRSMQKLGAWSFIVSSLCQVIAGVIQLARTVALLFLRQEQERASEVIGRAARSWFNRRHQKCEGRDPNVIDVGRADEAEADGQVMDGIFSTKESGDDEFQLCVYSSDRSSDQGGQCKKETPPRPRSRIVSGDLDGDADSPVMPSSRALSKGPRPPPAKAPLSRSFSDVALLRQDRYSRPCLGAEPVSRSLNSFHLRAHKRRSATYSNMHFVLQQAWASEVFMRSMPMGGSLTERSYGSCSRKPSRSSTYSEGVGRR
eukprot:TRINITY_DN15330_c0_g1_i1.p1 TRINITY_DN15330_c0_g1~~TRINITY_DN15330_c0_g1_i1.p1  ORF type:complete len:651 (-),score=98.45 TRINITY_DN15330_c0_g1_i1:27-1931(-)